LQGLGCQPVIQGNIIEGNSKAGIKLSSLANAVIGDIDDNLFKESTWDCSKQAGEYAEHFKQFSEQQWFLYETQFSEYIN
jgi:hypothetical protein